MIGKSDIIPGLRLSVMQHINHPEHYYQQALISKGVDITQLNHSNGSSNEGD